MTLAHLRPCPSCTRHIRVSESLCPFCGGAMTSAFAASSKPVPPTRRLARAALFALGASAVVAGVGCSSSDKDDKDASTDGNYMTEDAYGAVSFDAAPQPSYGASALLDGGLDAPPHETPDASADGANDSGPGMVDAAYGASPYHDASEPDSAFAPDASGVAAYGMPVMLDGGTD